MKKFLSLVLAMIMVMSLVTVGAGAAFTDAAEIQQTEAVALLSGLGVINGYTDGSFKPGNPITRGATTKILTKIMAGTAKTEALEKLGVTEKPFSDVEVDNTYAAFIEYCKTNGVVMGYPNGEFKPFENLKGYHFLKMVLVALGVKDIDWTAKGWEIEAAAKASGMDLLIGVEEVELSDYLSRENACQIAMNALGYTADAATYYPVLDKITGEVLYKCDNKEDQILYSFVLDGIPGEKVTDKSTSLGVKVFNLGEYTGVVTKNGAVDAVKANASKTTVGAKEFKVATDLSLIGHNVTVYYNTETNAVYSVYDNSKTLKLSNKATDLAALAEALDIDEDEVKAEYTCTKYDGTYATSEGKISVNLDTKKASSGTAIIVYNETTEKNEIIGFVTAATKYMDKVTKVTTTKDKETITLDGFGVISNGKLNADDKAVDAIVEYDGIAKGDYVVVTKAGDIYTVEKIKTVTGKITKITDDTKITVNGTTYTKNANSKTTVENQVAAADYDFATEYTLYLDGSGKYFAVSTDKPETKEQVVFFVEGYQKDETKTDAYKGTYTETTYWAQCVTLDGERFLFQTTEKQTLSNGLYTVTLAEDEDLDDGIEYATFAVEGEYYEGGIANNKILKLDSIYYFTDDVKFIAVEEKADLAKTKVTVKTGVQLVAADKTIYFASEEVKENGVATGNYTISYVFVDGPFKSAETKPTDDIVYAIETDASTAKVPYVKSGETKTGYEHVVYIDGVKTTIVTTDDDALIGFVELTKVVDGVYSTKENKADNLKANVVIENIFKSMITIEDEENLEDIDVADAKVIDLRDEDTLADGKELIDGADGLEKGMELAIVVDTTDKDAWTITTIYVIG